MFRLTNDREEAKRTCLLCCGTCTHHHSSQNRGKWWTLVTSARSYETVRRGDLRQDTEEETHMSKQ